MAGLTPEEERQLFYNQLNDPSNMQSSDDAFRARMTGGEAPPPPAVDRESFLGRLAGNPDLQRGLAGAAIGMGAGALPMGLGMQEIRRSAEPRQMQSFTRGDGGGGESDAPAVPVPMQTPDVHVPQAPTLDSRLAQIGRPMGGGGLGSGSGLRGAYQDAQAQQYQTLAEQQALTGEAGMSRVGQVEGVSQLELAEAERQRQAADDERAINEDAHRRMSAYLDATDRRVDEMAKLAPDPTRFMKSKGVGVQFAMAIGAVAGGMLSALNGGPNQFMETLERLIEQDIEAQRDAINNKKAALTERRGVLGQMLQQTGDARLDAREHRVALLQAAQMSLKAKSDSLGIPELRAQSELAINAIQQQIDAGKAQNAAEQWQMFQKQAAAAQAARRAAEKQALDEAYRWAELGLKRDALDQKNGGAPPGGISPGDLSKMNAEERKTQMELDANLRAVDNAQKDVDKIVAGSTVGKRWASLPPSIVPGAETARKNLNTREAYNRRVMIAVGAAYKLGTDATEPKNKELIEHFAAPYEITPSDTREIALSKMDALRKLLAESAASKGAEAPRMPASFAPTGSK